MSICVRYEKCCIGYANDMRYATDQTIRMDRQPDGWTKLEIEHASVGLTHACPINDPITPGGRDCVYYDQFYRSDLCTVLPCSYLAPTLTRLMCWRREDLERRSRSRMLSSLQPACMASNRQVLPSTSRLFTFASVREEGRGGGGGGDR